MKKLFTLILAAVLCLSVFAGCADTKKPTGGSNVTIDRNRPPKPAEQAPKNEITVTKASSLGEKYGDTKLYALEELTTTSPDGGITAYLWQDEKGGVYYSVEAHGEKVLLPAKLGITTASCDFSRDITEIKSYDRYDIIYDTFETAETISLGIDYLDYCHEQTVYLSKEGGSLTLKIRVYDDGFAFRYEDVTAGKTEKAFVTAEQSQIILPEDTVTFAGGYSATYECFYDKRDYKQFVNHSGVWNTPLTAETEDHWLLVAEADVYAGDITYGKSVLEKNSGSGTLTYAFGFDRDPANEVKGELDSPGHIRISEVITENGFTTPWRAVIIAKDLNGLVNSCLIDALGEPFDEEHFASTDWIKPGKVSWSWWSGDSQDDPDIVRRYIDFAAENGWEYYCLDAGWPAFEDQIPELCHYAEQKGVGLILWVNYIHLKTPEEIEELFSKWHKWGVVGVKTDYFESDEIDVLESMRNCAEIGAEYELMMYYHGCICPNGETRTYPNIMTTEAVLGEEFRKWSESPPNYVCLMYPFTRNILGSMDYTPSTIAISKVGESGGFALAKSVVYESTLQHFAANAKMFPSFIGLPFLNRIPTVWLSSTLLDGYPGEFVSYLRTDGEDYFIGSMTLEKRTQTVSLDFLGEGEYYAYIYKDNEKGKLILEEKKVTKADSITVEMGDAGGFVALLTKTEMDTEVEPSPDDELKGYTYYECEDGVLKGNARVTDSMACSGGKKVGYLGDGQFNNLTITVNVPADGDYELLLYYCSGEDRYVEVHIGDSVQKMTGLNSGGWDMVSYEKITVTLKKGGNDILLCQPMGYAPDVDRIAISEKAK